MDFRVDIATISVDRLRDVEGHQDTSHVKKDARLRKVSTWLRVYNKNKPLPG